jgi:hypothetical protein
MLSDPEAGLAELRKTYPWPDQRPRKPDAKPHGWFSGDNQKALAKLLTPDTKIVVELGSWFGLSAQFIARHAPKATIICIDHWKGSAEHHRRPDWKELLPKLYDGFLSNLWQYRDRVIPFKTSTLHGMTKLFNLGVIPDLVYVDAAHDEQSVEADIKTALRYFPNAEILGDDWMHFSVQLGVIRAAKGLYLRVPDNGINCWHIGREKRGDQKVEKK